MYPDTFSQYDEQQAILAYFERVARGQLGRFLDVGAWDAKTFSNTRALFELGWGGVLIDPSPFAIAGLLREYGACDRVELVQCALNTETLMLKLQMSEDSVSTADVASFEKWKTQTKFHGSVWVPSITFAQLYNQWGGFDFINLDAEGLSVDLFHSMLETGAKPPCCCVEHDNRLAELGQAATKVGYKMVYSNGTNAVFTL
jgi:hypothetical protein